MNTTEVGQLSQQSALELHKYALVLAELSGVLFSVGAILKAADVRELPPISTSLPVGTTKVEGDNG